MYIFQYVNTDALAYVC